MNSLLMDAKFRFGLIVIVIAASLAFAAACGSQSGSSKPAAQADGAIPGANAGWLSGPVAEPIAPEIVVLRAGGPANVELSVVEDAASLAAAHVKVDVAYEGDTAAVRIFAKGAPEVENALFELRYDMAGYGPDEWRMGEFMTRGAEGVFEDLTVGSTITM